MSSKMIKSYKIFVVWGGGGRVSDLPFHERHRSSPTGVIWKNSSNLTILFQYRWCRTRTTIIMITKVREPPRWYLWSTASGKRCSGIGLRLRHWRPAAPQSLRPTTIGLPSRHRPGPLDFGRPPLRRVRARRRLPTVAGHRTGNNNDLIIVKRGGEWQRWRLFP